MMRFAACLILLTCLAPAVYANDKPTVAKPVSDASCKPGCTSARQDCRAQVQHATEDDTSPALSMNRNTNAYAAAAKEARPESQQLRPTEAQAFRARRAERLQACDVQFRRCTSACG